MCVVELQLTLYPKRPYNGTRDEAGKERQSNEVLVLFSVFFQGPSETIERHV